MTPVDVVLIGRNEGARLVAALDSVQGQARQVAYVDSGSTDDSVAEARARGATVVTLDMSLPFTAAWARNAGFDALKAPELVLFIDGDCTLVPGFVDAARQVLHANPDIGLVTGWRAETHRDASVYNQLCDWEWRRPAGNIRTCGGDMLVRASLWRTVGGMNPAVIAAEDDEICCRFRKAGWTLHRIPRQMTRHDAAMHRFGQWWARAVRTGHGFAQVNALHPDHFVTKNRRVLVYGLALPLMFVLGPVTTPWLSALALTGYGYNFWKTRKGLRTDGLPKPEATAHAALITLSKIPNMSGKARYHLRRARGAEMRIIEYK